MSTLPRDVEPLLAHDTRVYTGKARAQLGFGLLFILFSLAGLIEIHPLLLWYHGGPVPAPQAWDLYVTSRDWNCARTESLRAPAGVLRFELPDDAVFTLVSTAGETK